METTVMSIREAIDNGCIELGKIFDYRPTHNEIILTAEETGTSMIQEYQYLRTQDLCWRIVETFSGKLYLIATDWIRNNYLWLGGKVGCENGPDLLHRLCKGIYSNPSQGLYARNIDALLYREMYQYICPSLTRYWLANKYEKRGIFFCQKGMLQITPRGIEEQKISGGLTEKNEVASILPVVEVPDNILVDILSKSFVEE